MEVCLFRILKLDFLKLSALNCVEVQSNVLNPIKKDVHPKRNQKEKTENCGRRLQQYLESSHSRLVPVYVLAVTEMFARWGGSADDSPGWRPSAWGGARPKKMKNNRKTTAPADEWVQGLDVSPSGFGYSKAKMNTIGSMYMRSNFG